MPRPPHICTCGRVVAHGARCTCQIASTRTRNARHDANRPSARDRGYDRDWQKARTDWLAFHPCCAMCGGAAAVVDHITPHRSNHALFWDWRNWQSLCASCHNRHKQRLERARV